MNGYIDDGYDFHGYIAADSDGLWDALEFTYRPAIRSDLARLDGLVRVAMKDELVDANAVVKSEKLAREFLVKHLKSWSITTRQGTSVPITTDSLERLVGGLFYRIYRIVRCEQTSDRLSDSERSPESDEDAAKN